MLQEIEWQMVYPMDFYANTSLGPWTVKNELNRQGPVARSRKNVNTEKSLLSDKTQVGSNVESLEICGGQRTECCGKCHKENEIKTRAAVDASDTLQPKSVIAQK